MITASLTTQETELTGTEAEVYSLISKAVELRVEGDSQASLNLLSESESLVESVSISRQGRFYNQRALALKDLGEYDRAILEFDRAAYCFELSGESQLRGMVYNNIARAYSLSGNYERAHKNVDIAIGLATDRHYLAQWVDQKANVFWDEGKYDLALIESDKAVLLVLGDEQGGVLAECLTTQRKIKQALGVKVLGMEINSVINEPISQKDPHGGGSLLSTPLECVQELLQNSHQLAGPLFTLIAMVADPDGDQDRYSAAWAALQFLYVHTPNGERELQADIESVQNKPQELSDTSS